MKAAFDEINGSLHTGCANPPEHVEFGTGFLTPETGATKRASETMSPHRDRKSPANAREKWPQKRLFY
jgi:hypothetical protein